MFPLQKWISSDAKYDYDNNNNDDGDDGDDSDYGYDNNNNILTDHVEEKQL